jgi:hypothetical protein
MLTASLVLLGISLIWLTAIVVRGLRRNSREHAETLPRVATPFLPGRSTVPVPLPAPDLYRSGHAAGQHRVA